MVDTHTALASDIEKENLFIQYDKSIKRVLANKPILARILKFTVHELSKLPLHQIEYCIDGNSVMLGQTFVGCIRKQPIREMIFIGSWQINSVVSMPSYVWRI